MRTLCLDMSTRRTGWAVFNGKKLEAYNLIEETDKDILTRIVNMYRKIQELIKSYKIDCIVCEDVPVSTHSNLEVGKNLCVLQGCLLVLIDLYNLKYYRLKPTEWRARIGLNHTLYICKACKHEIESVCGDDTIQCICGAFGKNKFEKKQLNDRFALKERAVKMANKVYGLDLKYYSPNSKKNEDDIAEAILIGCSFLKGYDNNGK